MYLDEFDPVYVEHPSDPDDGAMQYLGVQTFVRLGTCLVYMAMNNFLMAAMIYEILRCYNTK